MIKKIELKKYIISNFEGLADNIEYVDKIPEFTNIPQDSEFKTNPLDIDKVNGEVITNNKLSNIFRYKISIETDTFSGYQERTLFYFIRYIISLRRGINKVQFYREFSLDPHENYVYFLIEFKNNVIENKTL